MAEEVETTTHESCPWCGEDEELKCVPLEETTTKAIWCTICGAHGPIAATCEEAWDDWDER
jgi:transcription elongation factor Elf1